MQAEINAGTGQRTKEHPRGGYGIYNPQTPQDEDLIINHLYNH